ncbi:MAG: PIN domain-containing protein [Paludibacteraceae bacterium]|nr:PIN domain-containing protein [Paludibacteraceae bacterium]
MSRLFLDTNVVIDLLDKREPFYEDAVRLFTMAYHKQVRLIISPITFATAAYLLRKHKPDEIRGLLANLKRLSSVATTDEQVVGDSISSQFDDFEDALQYYAALKAKADVIITRNGKDFGASKIPVMTPAEYLVLAK